MLDIPVEPKFADEKVVFTFNFADELVSGETLAGSPTCTAEVIRGTDPDPSVMINGAAQVDIAKAKVLQGVMGGVPGARYRIRCLAPTSNAMKVLGRAYIIDVE